MDSVCRGQAAHTFSCLEMARIRDYEIKKLRHGFLQGSMPLSVFFFHGAQVSHYVFQRFLF
jgi:hypothetical protein